MLDAALLRAGESVDERAVIGELRVGALCFGIETLPERLALLPIVVQQRASVVDLVGCRHAQG